MSIGTFILGVLRVVKYSFALLSFVYLLLASPYHEEYLGDPHSTFDDDSIFGNLVLSVLLLGVHLPIGLWRYNYDERSRWTYTDLLLGIGFALMVAKWGYWLTSDSAVHDGDVNYSQGNALVSRLLNSTMRV